MSDITKILRAVKRTFIRQIETRLNAMVIRVVINAVNDDTQLQSVKVEGLGDAIDDKVEHFQPGGLSHVAGNGAEGVGVRVGGRGGHTLVLGLSNRAARLKGLLAGETAIYSTGLAAAKIVLKADGSVEITPGGVTPKLKVNGAIEATSEITAKAGTDGAVKLSTHLHATAMGPSGPPTAGT